MSKVELSVMATGSAEPALDYVAAAFEKETGHRITISYRYDRDVADVLVMGRRALEDPPKIGYAGRIEEGRLKVARSAGVGVAVRQGARIPDISTEEAIVKAILEADRVLVTEHHASGIHMQAFIKKRGIHDQVKAKLVFAEIGQDLVDRLLAGQGNEVMFLPINRMLATNDPRLNVIGPLPDTMQDAQDIFAVPMTESTHKDVAWEFARFCSGPGRAIFVANGFS